MPSEPCQRGAAPRCGEGAGYGARCCRALHSKARIAACHGRCTRWPSRRTSARRERARKVSSPLPALQAQARKGDDRRPSAPPSNAKVGSQDPLDALRQCIPGGAPVVIAELPGKGRGLVATRRIEAKEVVVCEEPVAWALDEEARDKRCANCARLAGESLSLQPCAGCKGSFLLCDACRTHPCCGAVKTALDQGHGVPGACAMLAVSVAEVVLRRDRLSAAIDALTWHRIGFTPEMRVFDGYPRMLQDVIHGAHVRCCSNQFAIRTRDRTPFGRGLFLGCSMANSDCDPNCSIYFRAEPSVTQITMEAVRPINAGEEVCGCYVEVFLPRSARLEQLRATWRFDCSCSRCGRALEPHGDERQLFGVRCTACGRTIAELEGECCPCGGDAPAARREAVHRAIKLREDAIALLSRRSTQTLGLLRPGGGRGFVPDALDAQSQALGALRESLALLRGSLASLHKEIIYSMNVLAEALRKFGSQAEHDTIREEFMRIRGERMAWIHGERRADASGEGGSAALA